MVLVAVRSQELRELLLYLGPCYIKLGQALCSRIVQGAPKKKRTHDTATEKQRGHPTLGSPGNGY